MPESLKKLRIFAASPSDVASERAKLETVVDLLKPLADYLGLTLQVLTWRDVVPDAGRPQQVIFDQLEPTEWDIFVGILWHRSGTPSNAINPQTSKPFVSGTEEEFVTTYNLWKQHGKPRIMMYRCTRLFPFDVDPDQLKQVNDFFKLIQDPKSNYRLLSQNFDTIESFEKLLLDNLQKVLIEYGEDSKTPITPEVKQVLAPKIPNNLPRRQAFFGRVSEIDKVMRTIGPEQTWGIVIDGIGGIGKSAIAIEAAYRAQEAGLFEAFVFVTAKTNILDPSGIKELTPPARTLDEFLNETVRVLGQPGIEKLTGDEKRRALIDVLRSMRTLLVYDNLETLSKEEQEGIADFLRELPQGCKAIITSRRRGGEGAVWMRVEKLDWDAARGIIENEIKRDAGLANKLNRVGESRWQELFDETNGSPLALVHTLGLIRVRAALTFDSALQMLRGNRDADLQKFIFQEARKELTENDKAALGALSFFAPSATFESLMEVAELTRNALETTIDRLSALSLVDVLAGEERYALHSLTRAFVRDELLAETKVARETGMRFTRFWVNYAERYGGGSENYKTYDRLEVEWTNLDAAVNWLWGTTNEDKEMAHFLIRLARSLNQFLWFVGRWDQYLQLNVHTYEVARVIENWERAGRYAFEVSWIHYNCARTDNAASWAEKCAEAWARDGSKSEVATAIRMRGLIARQRKDYEQAERLFQDALATWRSLGSDIEIAAVLISLGELERERKNYDTAERYYREALEIYTRRDYKGGQAVCAGDLGELALDRNQLAQARQWFEQALALANEVGDIGNISQAQYGLARALEGEGQLREALLVAQGALKIEMRLQSMYLANVQELVARLLKAEG